MPWSAAMFMGWSQGVHVTLKCRDVISSAWSRSWPRLNRLMPSLTAQAWWRWASKLVSCAAAGVLLPQQHERHAQGGGDTLVREPSIEFEAQNVLDLTHVNPSCRHAGFSKKLGRLTALGETTCATPSRWHTTPCWHRDRDSGQVQKSVTIGRNTHQAALCLAVGKRGFGDVEWQQMLTSCLDTGP
jgi:hypothetical protein